MKIKNKLITAVSAISLFYAGEISAEEISTNAAVMQSMDKVTGRVSKITVPVDAKIVYGDFSLVLRACKKRPAEEEPENFAFVDVTDKNLSNEEENIFRGWMVSSTPGLHAIEHPIYDIWLIECVNTEVDEKSLLSENELASRDSMPAKESREPEVEDKEVKAVEAENSSSQVIRIKDFINEDRDIEKDLQKAPSYISETPTSYISDIEEGEEPENLLLFTRMQEMDEDNKGKKAGETIDDLSAAIDAEINILQKN